MSLDANSWSAIASAFAAAGSLAVAGFSYFQQRANNRNNEVEKNIDRLIALAGQANLISSLKDSSERDFRQAANLSYAIDAAATRIIKLIDKLKLGDDESREIAGYFTDHLSFIVLEELRTKEIPQFKMDVSYSIDDVQHIQFIWKRAADFLLHDKRPD